MNEHTSIPDVMLISTHTWDKLNDQEKEWLTIAVNGSKEYQRKLWRESEEESLQAVKDAGIEVHYPDKKPFMEKVKPLKEQYKKDPELKGIIEAIDEISESSGLLLRSAIGH